MNFRTITKSALIAIIASTIVAVKAEAVTSSDLVKMEQKVQQQSLEHKKLQAQETQIILELSVVNKELIKAAKKIQNSEERLSLMERQLDKLKKELEDAEQGFSKEDENLIKTLAALQNLALKPTEAILVQPLTPVEIIRSAMLLRETVPYLEENAARLRKTLKEIAKKKSLVEKQFAQISKQKNILEQEHSKMKNLAQKKAKMRNAVAIKSEQAKKNVEKLANQANDLRDLLSKLEKQRLEKQKQEEKRQLEAKKAEEAKKLAEKKQAKTQTANLIKSTSTTIIGNGEEFKKAKGSLPMPARGKIITSYGEQMVKGVSAKGITIRTRNQAQVIAPFDGSVIFSGPFRGYGNLIIVEHGGGYLSLLAGLQTIDVEVGQLLLAGEPIGQMPQDGDAKLYMEIRKDNHPLDPIAWIKI